MNFVNLLVSNAPTVPTDFFGLYISISLVLTVAILILSVLAIVFVLMQPSNSDGINAITGSSETFFGKNKGKSIESKLKKWTVICLVVMVVLSIVFFVLQHESIWS